MPIRVHYEGKAFNFPDGTDPAVIEQEMARFTGTTQEQPATAAQFFAGADGQGLKLEAPRDASVWQQIKSVLPDMTTPSDPVLAAVDKRQVDPMEQPLVDLGRLAPPEPQTVEEGINAGLLDVAGGMTSPQNIALLTTFGGLAKATGGVAKALGRAAGAGFDVDQIMQTIEAAPEAKAMWAAGRKGEAARLAVHAIAGLALTGIGTRETFRGEAPSIKKQKLTGPQAAQTQERLGKMSNRQLRREVRRSEADPVYQEQVTIQQQQRADAKAEATPPAQQPPAVAPEGPRLNRDQRRQQVEPPAEPGPSQAEQMKAAEIAQTQAARKQYAEQMTGKKWADITNSELILVDELIAEKRRAGQGILEGEKPPAPVATTPEVESVAPKAPAVVPKTEQPRPAPKPLDVKPEPAVPSGQDVPRAAAEPARAADAGRPSEVPAVQPPSRPSNPARTGRDTIIQIPDSNRTIEARYVVRELDEVIPSHNPFSFAKNAGYRIKNDRDYRDASVAATVIEHAKDFKRDFLITDNPDLVNGPPLILESGEVIGGNSRAMTLGRVYAENHAGAASYREALIERAQQFGLDPAEISRMNQPILVRLAENIDDVQGAVTDTNRPGTAPLRVVERAVSDSRKITPETMNTVAAKIEAIGSDATLTQALEGRSGIDIYERMVEDGIFSPRDRNAHIDRERGELSPEVKIRINKMALGRLFGDVDALAATSPELLNKLERVTAPLLRSVDRPDWDLTATVREAVTLLQEAEGRGVKHLGDMVSNTRLEYDNRSYSPEVLAVAQTLQQGPIKAAKSFRQYAQEEALSRPGAPATFFEPPSKAESFAKAFGLPAPDALTRAETAARERLNSAFKGDTLSANPAALIGDVAIVGVAKLRRGVQKFSDWSREMVAELGERIKPYLAKAWVEARKLYRDERGTAPIIPGERLDPLPDPDGKGAKPAKVKAKAPAAIPGRSVSPNYETSKAKIFEKAAVSEGARKELAKSMGRWEKTNPERSVVSFDDIRQEAKQYGIDDVLDVDPKKLDAGTTLNPAFRYAASEHLNGLSERLADLEIRIEKDGPNMDPIKLMKLEEEVGVLRHDSERLHDLLWPARTQDGRNLAYYRMSGGPREFNVDYWLARARRVTNTPSGGTLPPDVRDRIVSAVGEGRMAEKDAVARIRNKGTAGAKAQEPIIEQRMDRARKAEVSRLMAELEGRKGKNSLTPEERQALANDPEIRKLRELVHDKRMAAKLGRSSAERVADKIRAERQRLSRLVEGDEGKTAEPKLTLAERAQVNADPVIKELRSRLAERRAAARQPVTSERRVERGAKAEASRLERERQRIEDEAAGVAPKSSEWKLTEAERKLVDQDPRVIAARRKLGETMRDLLKHDWLDTAVALGRANLLTATWTLARNMGSNAINIPMTEAARIPVWALETLGRRKHRTIQGPDFIDIRESVRLVVTKGIPEFINVMKHGATEQQMRALDFHREHNGPSPTLNAYIRYIMRFQAAQDALFKTFAVERSLRERAWITAMNEAGHGVIDLKDVRKRQAEILKTPDEYMVAESVYDSLEMTWQNETLAASALAGAKSKILQTARKMEASPVATGATKFAARAIIAGVDIQFPFVRTPSALASSLIQWTGGGLGKAAALKYAASVRKAITPFQEKQMALAVGRGLVGPAFLALGFALERAGLMSGIGAGKERGERETEKTAGKGSASIKIGDRWHTIAWAFPAGPLVTIGATVSELAKRDKFGTDAALIPAQLLLEQPLLKGAKEATQALEGPTEGRGSRLAASLAARLVPSIVNQVGVVADDQLRDTRATSPGDAVRKSIMSRVPGLRTKLPPRVDALGNIETTDRNAALDKAIMFLAPTASRRDKAASDPMIREMVRLRAHLSELRRREDEPDKPYTERQRLVGRAVATAIRGVMDSPTYQRLSDDERRDAVSMAAGRTKAKITTILGRANYDKSSEAERLRILTNLKESLPQ